MAKAMHAESGYRHLPLNELQMTAQIARWMTEARTCVFIYDRGGVAAGTIIGQVASHWFSDSLGGWDRIFYVLPDHRKGIVAGRLYKAFEDFCRRNGAIELYPAVSTGRSDAPADLGAFGRFYARVGAIQIGSIFRRRLG